MGIFVDFGVDDYMVNVVNFIVEFGEYFGYLFVVVDV